MMPVYHFDLTLKVFFQNDTIFQKVVMNSKIDAEIHH